MVRPRLLDKLGIEQIASANSGAAAGFCASTCNARRAKILAGFSLSTPITLRIRMGFSAISIPADRRTALISAL
jgi:hypothetical protein